MTQAATQSEMTLAATDLSLTLAAREKMAELFSQVDDADLQAIRVFVSGGGCGGMGYGMTFTDTRSEFDYVRKENGFNVYVDAVAINYLRGVEIDYVERPSGASTSRAMTSFTSSTNTRDLRGGVALAVCA